MTLLRRTILQDHRYRAVRQGGYEIFKNGAARVEFRDPYHLAATLPWPAFIAGFLAVLGVINAIFALLYMRPGAVTNLPPRDFGGAFFFSLETMSTVGYGEMAPKNVYGHWVAGAEMIFGMAFVAILTSVLVSRFSQTRDGIAFADRAVVTLHNGVPTLMVRCANVRFSMLTAAKATLFVLLKVTSSEGLMFRRHFHLAVLTPALPAFPSTWTVMHAIDEHSPLYGYDAERLAEAWGWLFLCVEARDVKLGRVIHEIGDWDHRQILFGARYVEADSYDARGTPYADLTMLRRRGEQCRFGPPRGRSDVMPVPAPASSGALSGAFLFAVPALFSIVNPRGRALR